MVYRLLAVLTVGMALVLADSAAAQAPSGDSATGAGILQGGSAAYFVDAHIGPSGENPTGTVNYTIFTTTTHNVSATVSCLNVRGNTAIVGYTGQEYSTDPPFHRLLEIVDNTAAGQPDTLTFSDGPYPTTGNPCATLPNPGATFTVGPVPLPGFDPGAFTVIDEQPPLPTSKQQCKDGGWQAFGTTFMNQGQCVAFVQRGPKP